MSKARDLANGRTVSTEGGSTVTASDVAVKPIILKGAASQTADLQQWQNSAGTVLSGVTNLGSIDIGNASGTSVGTGTGLGDKISLYQDIFGIGIQSGRIVNYVNTLTDGFAVRVKASSGNRSSGSDGVALLGNGSIVQTLASAAVVGLTVKGAASQTADLQQWQNSAGTVVASIGSDGTFASPVLKSPEERTTVSATAATGTVNFDASTQGVLYYTTNASGNWTLNVRGTSGTTLSSVLAVGDAITVNFLVTNGSTAYYQTAFNIDGTAVTPKYSGGTAPASGNASSVDVYTYTIVKTATTPTYTVFGAGPIKYA